MTSVAEAASFYLEPDELDGEVDESSQGKSAGTLNTLARGLSILEAIARSPSHQGLSQGALARQLGFRRSTLYRYLACLQELGFVESVETARYRLGSRIVVLGAASTQERGFPRYTRQFVRALAKATGETAHATIFDQGYAVTIELADGTGPVGPRISVGSRREAYCSASGKVFLAHVDHHTREEYLARKVLQAKTSSTIVDADAFRLELDTVRRRGFALDHGELVHGISCMAAPVFDLRFEVVGALSVSVAAEVLSVQEVDSLGRPLLHISRAFSRMLGCPEDKREAAR